MTACRLDTEEIIKVMGRVHDRDISPYDASFLARSIGKRPAAAGIRTWSAGCAGEAEREIVAKTDGFRTAMPPAAVFQKTRVIFYCDNIQ